MSGENKRNVRPVKVGGLTLDGKKIYIQSMLNVPSTDIEGSVKPVSYTHLTLPTKA